MAVNLRRAKEDIEMTRSIELITQALGDIATSKIKRIRGSIEHTVSYFQEITTIYKTVKSLALRNNPTRRIPGRATNGRTICVILTANSNLYGTLDSELTNFFSANTLGHAEFDKLVVGKHGVDLLGSIGYKDKFESYFFKKDLPDAAELADLAKKVFYHERILIFYSKFMTLLNQVPFISDISTAYLAKSAAEETLFHYITEPEVDKVLAFFDSQMSILLFQSIFLEVELSRLAARMITMNQAEDNAKKILKQEKKELLRIRRSLINLSILDNYNSMIGVANRKDF